MQPLELAPPGMVGWLEEMEYGQTLVVSGPNRIGVKIVITPRSIVVFALAEQTEEARALLLQLGFKPEHIRRMLCG